MNWKPLWGFLDQKEQERGDWQVTRRQFFPKFFCPAVVWSHSKDYRIMGMVT